MGPVFQSTQRQQGLIFFLQYHSCKLSSYLWVTSRIHLYQAIQVILSVTLKFLPGAVTEPQIGAVFYIIGPPPHPLVNCFDHTLRNWVLSPIEAFEYAPSFPKKKELSLMFMVVTKEMDSFVCGVILLEGCGLSCDSQYVPTTNLK